MLRPGLSSLYADPAVRQDKQEEPRSMVNLFWKGIGELGSRSVSARRSNVGLSNAERSLCGIRVESSKALPLP